MKPTRSKSYGVGPYTIRRDPTGLRFWRVFTRSVAIYHSLNLQECLDYARTKCEALAAIMGNAAAWEPYGRYCPFHAVWYNGTEHDSCPEFAGKLPGPA